MLMILPNLVNSLSYSFFTLNCRRLVSVVTLFLVVDMILIEIGFMCNRRKESFIAIYSTYSFSITYIKITKSTQ